MNGCSTVNMDRDSFKENQGDFSFYMTWVLLCDPHLHIKMNASITNLKNNNNNNNKAYLLLQDQAALQSLLTEIPESFFICDSSSWQVSNHLISYSHN